MIPYDIDFEKNCIKNDHSRFDLVCQKELKLLLSVDKVMDSNDFCISIDIDILKKHSDVFLSINEHLNRLKNKMGIYSLWINLGYCNEHKKYKMLCVYVGKGNVIKRIKDHITDKKNKKAKWNNAAETLYISFYECENRIAKYIEQLFLDTYNFYLNKSENSTGIGSLYSSWDKQRVEEGTEYYRMAEIYSLREP